MATPATASPPRKLGGPGQPWSDLETAHLISAYADKWYSLKRGPLKAHQWEDVASALAARCGLRIPNKNGTQCRHKMEKLRKRYRAERKLPDPSRWLHFHLIDRMESGPLPVSARLFPGRDGNPSDGDEVNNSDGDGDNDDEDEAECPVRLGETGHMIRNTAGLGRCENWGSYNHHNLSARDGVGVVATELARLLVRFTDQFQRIEKRRMELMVELERDWMEMESRKMQMVIESQQYLVNAIAAASEHPVKKKRSS